MTLNDICRKCLLDKFYNGFPEDAPEEKKAEYREKVLNEVYHDGGRTSPEIVERITKIYRALFGPEKDYSEIKSHYNRLMLSFEKMMRDAADSSPEPLLTALRYAAAANYIDFSAMDSVDENKLGELLMKAKDVKFDENAYLSLKKDVSNAKRLVYFTDNCGEIVADKLVIRAAERLNPQLEAYAIVRGEQAVNDATLEDAYEVGLDGTAKVVSSGSGVGGNVMRLLSDEARKAAESADVLISKGQANYETLEGCGLNVYYIFLCKCDRFLSEFNVPRFTPILTKERTVNCNSPQIRVLPRL